MVHSVDLVSILTLSTTTCLYRAAFKDLNLVRDNYGTETKNEENFKNYLPNKTENSLEDFLFQPEDVRWIIAHLNNNKGTYFSPRILKLVTNKLSPILALIFNNCINDGYFPNELKTAKIILFFSFFYQILFT